MTNVFQPNVFQPDVFQVGTLDVVIPDVVTKRRKWLGISVPGAGRVSGASAFAVSRDSAGILIGVRDKAAPQFAVSRDADGLLLSALPVYSPQKTVYIRGYASIAFAHSPQLACYLTLLINPGAGYIPTDIYRQHFVWRFTSSLDRDLYAAEISMGWWLMPGVFIPGIGPLLANSDYRLRVEWYSYSGHNWSYNAIDDIAFSTTSDIWQGLPWFLKHDAQIEPEWSE